MDNTNWLKQTADKPLFPDVIWNKPENRRHAGKLLIIGGNSHSFAAVSSAYAAAQKAGAGSIKVILPDALEKTLGKSFPEAEFASSTPSGSLARTALGHFLDATGWADGVLLAGDFGKNSETAVLLDGFIEKYKGQLTIAGDGTDYFIDSNSRIISREDTLLVADFSKIQKLLAANQPATALNHDMSLHNFVETLHNWTSQVILGVITFHAGQATVALQGKVSTTPLETKDWQTVMAARASVWRMQQPKTPFESITSAFYTAAKGE